MNNSCHLLGREACAIASQPYPVKFFDYPVNSIVTPEGFARNYNCWNTKDPVAIGFCARFFKGGWSIIRRITREFFGVERTFAQHRRDRRSIFNIKFTLEEALEYPRRVLAKAFVALGIDSAHHRQARVEQLLWSPDYHSTFVGEAADILIEIADLIPIVRLTLFQLAAISSARLEVAWNEAQLHAMRSLERKRRPQCQICKRALEIVIELYRFVACVHGASVLCDSSNRLRAKALGFAKRIVKVERSPFSLTAVRLAPFIR